MNINADTANGTFDNGRHLLVVNDSYTDRMDDITISFSKFNKKKGWIHYYDFQANTPAMREGELVLVKKGNGTIFGVAADVYLTAIEHARSICKDIPSVGNLSKFSDWRERRDES